MGDNIEDGFKMYDELKIISEQLDFSVSQRDVLLCTSEDICGLEDICNQLKSLLLTSQIDKFCLQLEKQKTSNIIKILLNFVSEGLEKDCSAAQQVMYQKDNSLSPFILLQAAKCLIDNCFFKDEFAVCLEKSLLFCLTSPESVFNLNSYCCLLKDFAADVLSGLIKKYKSIEQRKRVIESIKGTFKIKEPPSIHYGAIVVSLSLGIEAIIEVIPEAFKYICDLYNVLPKEDPMKVWKISAWELKLKEKIIYAYKQMVDCKIKYESEKANEFASILSKMKDYKDYFGDDLFLTLKSDDKDVEPAKWQFFDLLLNEEVIKC